MSNNEIVDELVKIRELLAPKPEPPKKEEPRGLWDEFIVFINKALGAFISLIVVNCLILSRAEAFASKNTIGKSILDGLGMGLGFTFALFCLGAVREILGNGTFFNMALFPKSCFPRGFASSTYEKYASS